MGYMLRYTYNGYNKTYIDITQLILTFYTHLFKDLCT